MCFPNRIAPVINVALGELLHLSNCIYLTQNMGGMAVSQDPKKAMEKHHKEPYSALAYHITLERPVIELFPLEFKCGCLLLAPSLNVCYLRLGNREHTLVMAFIEMY